MYMETYTIGPLVNVCEILFREYSGMEVPFRVCYESKFGVICYQPPVGIYQLSCGKYYCHELVGYIVTSHAYEIAYRRTANVAFHSAMLRVSELCVAHPRGFLTCDWL